MKKIFSIMLEEFKNFLSNKGAVMVIFIGTILYSLLYSMPYSMEVVKEVPVGVVDFDNTTFSRDFVRGINATDYIDVKNKYLSLYEAEKDFYKDKIKAIVVIPKEYEKKLLRGEQTDISLYADTAYLIIYKSVYTGVMSVSIEKGAKIEVAKMLKKGISKNQALALKQPFQFVPVPLYNPAGGYDTYVYPVILILILHQTLLIGVGIIQGDRNEEKIRFCKDDKDIPLNLFAKSSSYVLLYILFGALFFLVYPAVFNLPMYYNIIPLFVIYVLMLYAASFFAYTMSWLFNTREDALLYMVVSSLFFIFIAGLIWPREAMPTVLNLFSFFIPATCGIDGIIKINMQDATFWQVKIDFIWLIVLNILYFYTAKFVIKNLHKKYLK